LFSPGGREIESPFRQKPTLLIPIFLFRSASLLGLSPDPFGASRRWRATVTISRLSGSGPTQFRPPQFFYFLKLLQICKFC
jgi:hypothetical protein